MQYATKYEILRNVSPTGATPCKAQPSTKPLKIACLLNEEKFVSSGGQMAHLDTVFLEDRGHDWDWRKEAFYYYGHAMGLRDKGDLVAVFELENMPLPKADA